MAFPYWLSTSIGGGKRYGTNAAHVGAARPAAASAHALLTARLTSPCGVSKATTTRWDINLKWHPQQVYVVPTLTLPTVTDLGDTARSVRSR